MAFKHGNSAAKNRKARRGGRPTREQRKIKLTYEQAFNKRIAQRAVAAANKYIDFAMTDPATARHMADKFIPPVQKIEHTADLEIKIVTNVKADD